MSHFKRSQRKYVKKTYRVLNWHEYEAGLRERGSLTVWISLNDGKLANWMSQGRRKGNQAVNASTRITQLRRLSLWAWFWSWRPGRPRGLSVRCLLC